MILGLEQMKYLEVAGEETYFFKDNGKATDKERKELKELDKSFLDIEGSHLILNYGDL